MGYMVQVLAESRKVSESVRLPWNVASESQKHMRPSHGE